MTSRTASFRSAIALMLEGQVYTFPGEVQGTISLEMR
ncbi:MAG: non-canonical purine NTP pyrophosphatase, partial [Promethearchaeota archaeon]